MFDRLPIPTPFQVGRVNAYLATGDRTTLVDPGPDSETAREALADELDAHDLAPADVDRVLVTHPHPDHFGLANYLAESGAEIHASPAAAAIVQAFEDRLEYEQAYFTALFETHGMDPETARTVTELPAAFVEYAPSVAVDRELEAGDELSIDGRDVGVRELVGHSVGELAFEFDSELTGDESAAGTPGRTAIVGDHVLPDATPNPFLQPPEREGLPDDPEAYVAGLFEASPATLDDARPRVLPAYNDSLDRLREFDYDLLLPGHGEPIDDPATQIESLRAAHEDRTDAVRDLVDGPTTAVDVLHGLFPDLAVVDYFGAMSEAVGHLDVLERRGEVERQSRNEALVYVRT